MPKPSLDELRSQLDEIDAELIDLLARRLDVCREVARFKKSEGIRMMQPARVEIVKRRAAEKGKRLGLDEAFVRKLYGLIIDEACRLEDEIIESR